jgi:tRNA(Arg) A34 adenosine deaminase TadA
MNELDFLRRAIQLSLEAREQGNPPFGSLLVSADGVVLAEDRNTTNTDRDVTAHPELKLARWAARELPPEQAQTTTMYTSCQPCSMCASVIARAGLGRVVFALSTEQVLGLRPAGFVNPGSDNVPYDGPNLFDEAIVPFDGYYT